MGSSSSRKRFRASNFDIPQQQQSSRKESLMLNYLGQDLSPTMQLLDLGGELDYQGQVLSRIVRDIHFQHENGSSGDNPAIHGLGMVLTEIRGLREELREHQSKLDNLREDVNMIINTNRVDTDR